MWIGRNWRSSPEASYEPNFMSLMIGIPGTRLDASSRAWLRHPNVESLILFARNYQSREQLAQLLSEVRSVRPSLIVAIDQEGGPVQRLRHGFSALPALAEIGSLFVRNARLGIKACRLHARLMVCEVRAAGIDISLAPVADLGRGNRAIGSRAFASDPLATAKLSAHYVSAMQDDGMAATLKHFPGHGSVLEDTHFDFAIDRRALPELIASDLLPFAVGIGAGARAVMMAHVCYPDLDPLAAGYSRLWLQHVLRAQLGFQGVIMGDDISMAAGASAGSIQERVLQHYLAGCDLVLACQPDAVEAALQAPCVKLGARHAQSLRAAGESFPTAERMSKMVPRWSQQLGRLLDAQSSA